MPHRRPSPPLHPNSAASHSQQAKLSASQPPTSQLTAQAIRQTANHINNSNPSITSSNSTNLARSTSLNQTASDLNTASALTTSITSTETDSVVQLVDKLLKQAIELGASDLHFEPYEHFYRVRFRIDGLMQQVASPDIGLHLNIAARLKIMAQMDIAERRLPQDGRIKLSLANDHHPNNKSPNNRNIQANQQSISSPTIISAVKSHRNIDFRVNSLPTLFGEKIVLRVIDPLSSMVGIDHLGFEPLQKQLLLEALHQPQGIILITGPTGSGKTVSLYTGLDILNTPQVNISSVEDPIEINLAGINQVNVNHKVGLTFATALKSFLRQDPDIIMVGEIRDLETADTVIKASQTGHLVLSTLHTNSAAETLTRLHHMGVPYFNIATSISLVVAQRLARRLCPVCKKPAIIPHASLIEMGLATGAESDCAPSIYEAVGCDQCHQGYKGRVGIFEVIKMDERLAQIIMQGGNAIDIKAAATTDGFFDLRQAAILKVLQGVISVQEMYRVTAD
ncbi:GspE/PulE family protein [Psychrobacter sp. FDAARGOS_221]|uniref:GspE/PulE family protein n=1 Tax=Psychrobacter sp. FDAARGOS_221 TaxID=1975705 RepID=UPI000BB582C3|nr:ATPase, T2SS/T4P/T4SS family [Psychrobacter sp. FDAARGOS_221]PNK60589.1 Type 4 pili biogenesis protein pilB (nuleotide-binding protein) [Psychrobacter sp. FDAARGOS_221]